MKNATVFDGWLFQDFLFILEPQTFSLECKTIKTVRISRENVWGFKGFRTFSPRQIQITTDNKKTLTMMMLQSQARSEAIKQDALERENE